MIKLVSFVFILGLLSNLVTLTNLQTNYVSESISVIDISNSFFFDKTLDSFFKTESDVVGLEIETPFFGVVYLKDLTFFEQLDHDFIFIDNYLHNIPPPFLNS